MTSYTAVRDTAVRVGVSAAERSAETPTTRSVSLTDNRAQTGKVSSHACSIQVTAVRTVSVTPDLRFRAPRPLPVPGAFSMKSVAMLMSRPKLSSSTWACRATASRIQTGGRRKPTRRAVPLLYIYCTDTHTYIHSCLTLPSLLRFWFSPLGASAPQSALWAASRLSCRVTRVVQLHGTLHTMCARRTCRTSQGARETSQDPSWPLCHRAPWMEPQPATRLEDDRRSSSSISLRLPPCSIAFFSTPQCRSQRAGGSTCRRP